MSKNFLKIVTTATLSLSIMSIPVFASTDVNYYPIETVLSSNFQPVQSPYLEYETFINSLSTEEVESYAYMDYSSAPTDVQPLILEARSQIVYGDQGWSAEEGAISVEYPDGSIEVMPTFSELWPDWDLAQIDEYTDAKYNYDNVSLVEIDGKAASFAGPVDLPLQSAQNGKTFYSFNSASGTAATWASTLPLGTTVNIGYTNEDTGADAGWIPNVPAGRKVQLNGTSGTRYSVRASLTNVSGTAYMNVSE